MKKSILHLPVLFVFLTAAASALGEPSGASANAQPKTSHADEYQYADTRQLVQLVNDAAGLVAAKGNAAFTDFRALGSPWRQEEKYIFVLDREGKMLVHPDPAMEGKNQMELKDVNGRPIIRELIAAVSAPNKTDGWYHYQWPRPGEILPRWKSTYVRLVTTPAGEKYIVGCGVYNDRMERSFVIDAVKDAAAAIEQDSDTAYRQFRDPTSRFMAKDAYIFVVDQNGVELVNPAFRNLEGRKILDVKDAQGKELVREMLKTVRKSESGWVDYLWPKPGESVPTLKSAYVSKAKLSNSWVLVGCGVYLADAPKKLAATKQMTAPELMALVREAAGVFEKRGEAAYPEFRKKGSKWFRDDGTYFFVWSMEGVRLLNPGNPAGEGKDVRDMTDVLGRPVAKMFLATAASPSGEGWVHYMHPEPGDIFPTWKSTFLKRVSFPSGKPYLIGCGIYNMEMDPVFTEDVVNRAAALVAEKGSDAFSQLRDKTGPYLFLDTYIFVNTPDGVEVVNPAQPTLEGKNLMSLTDVNGKLVARDYIDMAMNNGSGWVDYYWYKPGNNTPTRKHTYVRKVQHGGETYIVGSGYYVDDADAAVQGIQKRAWKTVRSEMLNEHLSRQTLSGAQATLAQFSAQKGSTVGRHSHQAEEYLWVTSGALKVGFDDREVETHAGEVLVIPSNTPHSIAAVDDATFVDFFTPLREDWQRGEDQYLRK